jgi:hypothetical protein
MTVEHRIVVGMGDIIAVTFECRTCHTRTSVPATSLQGVPRSCSSCNSIWWTGTDMSSHVVTSGPAAIGFIQAIITLRALIQENRDAFRILLEFDGEEADANA